MLCLALLVAGVPAASEPVPTTDRPEQAGEEEASATATATAAGSDPRRQAREAAGENLELTRPEKLLIRRPDRERPKKQITFPLFGRPLVLGGRYTLLPRYEGNKLMDFDYADLDNQDVDEDGDLTEIEDLARGLTPRDDQLRINQGLQTDLFYAYSNDASIYAEMKFFYRALVWAENVSTRDEWLVERGETWFYLGNLLDTPFGLQVGRQRFFDAREWWWDQDLDSIRVRFDRENFHAEIAVAHELFPVVLNRGGIEPEDDDVVQILSAARWSWAKKQEVGFFALHRNDYSNQQSVDPLALCVSASDYNGPPEGFADFQTGCVGYEDDSDSQLTWLGVSASGRWKVPGWGRIEYWLDAAAVFGDETFTEYSGMTGSRVVKVVDSHSVSGGGFDLGGTWFLPLFGRTAVTAGYAYGSGDPGMEEFHDTGFRQTGLQDNSDKFLGVASFRYYGELLDPELSNLHVVTAGVGLRFFKKSSIDLVYHWYRQAQAAPFMHDIDFKRDPTGLSPDIGQEWDLILGIEEMDRFEFKVVGSIFRPGEAFDPEEGDLAYLVSFRFRFNF